MKILQTFIHERDFDFNIKSFHDYAPIDMEETLLFDEADAVFVLAHNSDFYLNVSKEQLEANGYKAPDQNLVAINNYPLYMKDTIDEISQKIVNLPRMTYLEAFGCETPRVSWPEDGSLPRAIRDIDIPISTANYSELHQNFQWVTVVDNRRFYPTRKTTKRDGTVTVMMDAISHHPELAVALVKSKSVTRLNVLRADQNGIRNMLDDEAENPKVHYFNASWPEGMRNTLSDSEWTLHCNLNAGIEMMGIEGGMCGAHPIYPDMPYYRRVFGDDVGVAYFDIDTPVDSVLNIIKEDRNWDEHIRDFTHKFGAEYHMPTFWKNVRSIIGA